MKKQIFKKFKLCSIFILAVSFVLCLASISDAKKKEPILFLEIISDKTTFVEGENIIFTLKWKNISDKVIERKDFFFNVYNYKINAHEEGFIFMGTMKKPTYEPTLIKLRPDQEYIVNQNFSGVLQRRIYKKFMELDEERFDYLPPGKYTISKPQSRFRRHAYYPVESNSLTIEILPKKK